MFQFSQLRSGARSPPPTPAHFSGVLSMEHHSKDACCRLVDGLATGEPQLQLWLSLDIPPGLLVCPWDCMPPARHSQSPIELVRSHLANLGDCSSGVGGGPAGWPGVSLWMESGRGWDRAPLWFSLSGSEPGACPSSASPPIIWLHPSVPTCCFLWRDK